MTVVLELKSSACAVPWHVTGLPMFDHREALRPPTRMLLTREEGFEEEG